MENKEIYADLFTSRDTLGAVLLTAAYAIYGSDFMNWDPAAVRLNLNQDLGTFPPIEVTNRLQAAVTVALNDYFFKSPDLFFFVADSLNRHPADPTIPIPPNLPRTAWTIMEAKFIRSLIGTPVLDYSPELATYAGILLTGAGMEEPPEYMSWADFPEPPDTSEALDLDPDFMLSARETAREQREMLESYVTEHIQLMFTQLSRIPDVDKDVVRGISRSIISGE